MHVIPTRRAAISDVIAQSDEQLMVLYAQGNYSAFKELYRRHAGRVYGFLKMRVANQKDAEDMLQQVFLKVHQHRMRFDPRFPFLAWVFTIARNIQIDGLRKQRPMPMEEAKLQTLVDRQSNAVEEKPDMGWAEIMDLLPVDQRRLLERRFEEGLSFEQIANQTGISVVSARKRMSRSIKILREKMIAKGRKS